MPGILHTQCLVLGPNSSILVSPDQRNLLFTVREAYRCFIFLFCLPPVSCHFAIQATQGCIDCSSVTLSNLHTGSLKLRVTIGFLVNSLAQALLSKCPGCAKPLTTENYRVHRALRNLQFSTNYFVAFPKSLPCNNPVSEFCSQIL